MTPEIQRAVMYYTTALQLGTREEVAERYHYMCQIITQALQTAFTQGYDAAILETTLPLDVESYHPPEKGPST